MLLHIKTIIYSKFQNFKGLLGNLQGSYSKTKAYIVIKILQTLMCMLHGFKNDLCKTHSTVHGDGGGLEGVDGGHGRVDPVLYFQVAEPGFAVY